MKEPQILLEDDSILVMNKPSGWVVNRCETAGEQTIQSWLEKYLKIPDKGIGRRAGIVHRLDKETSGILLVAKTPAAFENLQNQFKERRVEKRYLALVHGQVVPKCGIIRASISRSPFNRKKFGVFLGGREAETGYRILRYYGDFTLLELMPKTGRTHQIRVHLKYVRHPVVGDEFYAGRKTARSDRQWCPRQFLHACYLKFIHPKTGKSLEIVCNLPSDLEKALERLER